MIVIINTEEVPPPGTAQTVFRYKASDKADVARAARKLDMKLSEFMRTVLVQAARRVLDNRE